MKFIYGITATLIVVLVSFGYYFISIYIRSELELSNFVLAEISKYFIKDLLPNHDETYDDVNLLRNYFSDISNANPKGSLKNLNYTIVNISRKVVNYYESNLTLRIIFPSISTADASTNDYNKFNKLPVILWFHGGGFVFSYGSIIDCTTLSKLTGFIIVDVDYRLAPEHNYPMALEDAAIALSWIHKNIHLYEGDPNTIIVGGTSAGGNLATALTALTLDNRFFPLNKLFRTPEVFQITHIRLKGLILSSPMLQYDTMRPSWFTYRNTIGFLTLDQVLWYWTLYIGIVTYYYFISYY